MSQRVLIVDETSAIGGAEINLVMVAPRLGALGWAPQAILPSEGRLSSRLSELNVPIAFVPRPVLFSSSFYLGHRYKIPNPLALVANAVLGLLWIWTLYRNFRQAKPALVQTISMWSHAFGGLAAWMAGCRLVWHFQDIVSPRSGLGLHRALVRLFARHIPDRIICISDLVAEQFRADPRAAAKVAVLWNTVDLDLYQPAPAGERAGQPLTIGTAARLTPWKGHEVALRAARELKRRGVPFCWRFVGEEALGAPGYRARLLRLIEEYGLSAEVELCGWTGDMPAFYRSLDALAHLPTEPEPYGLVLAEALASGLPVVASAGGGADPVVRSGGGVLVSPGDAQAAAAALTELYQRPAERAAKRVQARQAAERLFDPRRYAEQLAGIYDSVAR